MKAPIASGFLWVVAVSAACRWAVSAEPAFEPVRIPDWVYGVTRMVFITPGEIDVAEKVRAQVIHTNVVWPYYPLRREGGGLAAQDAVRLKGFVGDCHKRGMKIVLGLPPFMPVTLVKAHPDWRVHPDDSGAILKVEPREDNLGTRSGCNVGPWGDYLIDLVAELMTDYGLDGYSFDGNYHAGLCFCPACKEGYRKDRGLDLPKRADLDDVAYRVYLVWRGQRLEAHYRHMQERLKRIDPNAVLMSWTVNAGRYGHLLTSPRAMPTRLNLLFDLPMQEWWLDETNLGASVAPAFGVAYLRGIVGGRPSGSEPYLMSRGNPYSSDSFPRHERITRALLAVTHGSVPPQAGWLADRGESMSAVFEEIDRRGPWLAHARPMPWAALLVSEQTRQFYAYKDIPERFLPHVFGAFRAAMEEHLPLELVNDWDLEASRLAKYRVLILPGAAALSDAQAEAVRRFVREGGGLVATCETSLCDELGRARRDFALADVLGVSYRGRRTESRVERKELRVESRELRARRSTLDCRPSNLDSQLSTLDSQLSTLNSRLSTLDAAYWRDRVRVARLSWGGQSMWADAKLDALAPPRAAVFRGPLVAVSEPAAAAEVAGRFTVEGATTAPLPAIVVRSFGKGRVVYFAAGVDAALWSYAYPYQRRLLTQAVRYAAQEPFPIEVEAPMCVQATFFEQGTGGGRRMVIHLFNDLNTSGGHGLPQMDVPLREEAVPIHGIKVRFAGRRPAGFQVQPGGIAPKVRQEGAVTVVELPPLAIHAVLVAEWSKEPLK